MKRCCKKNGAFCPIIDEDRLPGSWQIGVAMRCRMCHEWLPLGPATETGEHAEAVAIEVRAAELATLLPDSFDESALEWAGRRHFIEGHEMPTSFGGLAGWLAAAINTHDDTTPPPGAE